MKIVLFRPRPHKETIGLQNVMICEPLELEYIASNVEPLGHEVVIVDMILEKKKIAYFLEKHKPDVVGVTGYIAHVNIIKDYARQVKEYSKDITTIVGGVHAEVNPEDFEDPNIDYIIRANGIKTFISILKKLENQHEIDTVKNSIISKEDINENRNDDGSEDSKEKNNEAGIKSQEDLLPDRKSIVSKELNNAQEAVCQDDNPLDCVYTKGVNKAVKETTFNYLFPDRDKVSKYRKHYYYMFHRNCSLIKTSFGCPYNCKFCFCRQITDDKYFARSLENIIEELKTIPQTEVYIVDDDFLFNAERLMEFCDLLEKNNIHKKYLVYGRADFIANNEAAIKRLKEVGLRAVIVGLESCSSKDLDTYNKRTQVSINEKAVSILQKYDVECYGTFILGLDWAKEDFNALGRWIKKLGLIFVNLQPLTPLRGNEMYEQYRKDFIIREDEYEKWDLAHLVVKPMNLSVRKYYWYTMVLYYKITANPKSWWYMVKKYGLYDTLKLTVGAAKVNMQYFKKLL